jgi:hypothetical protein
MSTHPHSFPTPAEKPLGADPLLPPWAGPDEWREWWAKKSDESEIGAQVWLARLWGTPVRFVMRCYCGCYHRPLVSVNDSWPLSSFEEHLKMSGGKLPVSHGLCRGAECRRRMGVAA